MTVNKWKMRFGAYGVISRVELNGEDISNSIHSVSVEASADGPTTVTVVYSRNEIELEAEEEEES